MKANCLAANTQTSGIRRSLHLVAAVACLWPTLALAGPPNPTGSDTNGNTAGGDGALNAVGANAYSNTAFGYYALTGDTSGSLNTAVGRYALKANTSGEQNTACGYYALDSNTTGSYNTASGAQALISNTTGIYNTALGASALVFNSTGNWNTASGFQALYSNTDGGYNTASGYLALFRNTTGGFNTAIGTDSLHSNTTGGYGIAIGSRALYSLKTGLSNVAVGVNALTALGGNSGGNVALGANAGYLTKTGSNDIYIGNYGIAGNESNVTRIGRTQTKVFVKGIAGVPLSGASVVINSAGQLGVVASSARYKQDIKSLGNVSERLTQLRPVSFSYKTEPGATHYGLIAEEVDKVMPELVVRDEQSRPESVQYLELIPLLLAERQEMQTEMKSQLALIEQQAKALAELRRIVDTRLAFDDTGHSESGD